MEVPKIQDQFKISKINFPLNDVWKQIFHSSESSLFAIVESIYKNGYGLDIKGKKIFIPSDIKLFQNEILHIKIFQKDNLITVEILNREFQNGENQILQNSRPSKFTEIFSNLFSKETVHETKLFQVLNSYFPEINWNEETQYFDWQFQDGEGKGFFGNKEDYQVFFMELNFIKMGELDITLKYKKNDLSDLYINIFTSKNSSYNIILSHLESLKTNLYEIGIEPVGISIQFSNLDTNKDWLV